MVEVKEIKKFEVFNVFSEKQLEELSKITEKKIFEKGALVYQRGYRADRIYLVTKGLVGLDKLKPGEKIGISFEHREKGDLFGTACFLELQKYSLTAVCLQDSEVMSIYADKFFELCQSDPELGYKFLKKVVQIYFERYQAAKGQIHEMIKTHTITTSLTR